MKGEDYKWRLKTIEVMKEANPREVIITVDKYLPSLFHNVKIFDFLTPLGKWFLWADHLIRFIANFY